MARNSSLSTARFSILAVSAAASFSYIAQGQAQEPQKKSDSRPQVQYLTLDPNSTLPFSDAVRVGDWLILSGKVGTDSSGTLVSGGIKAETKQTMENLKRVLEAYGASFDDVVKCTVMLADMKEWSEMNEIYRTYFKKNRLPARSALGANGLALGARVEIECWALVRSANDSAKASESSLQQGATAPRSSPVSEDQIVTTRQQVNVAGRVLKYTVRAGRVPILDNETGEAHANI